MPVPPDPITTYDLSVGTMLDAEDAIDMLDPADTPLLSGITAGGTPVISRGTVTQRSYSWFDEERSVAKTTLGANYTAGDTVITTASAQSKRFLAGQVIINDTTREKFRIVSIDYTTDILTVIPSFGSVATANGTSGQTIRSCGWALPEGSRPSFAPVKDRTERTNVTMILGPKAISMSGTEQVIRKYGVRSEWDHQAALKLAEIMVDLEFALIYAELYNDVSQKIRVMDGIVAQLDTNIDSNAGSINDVRLIEMLQDIVDFGGPIADYALIAGSEVFKDFSQFETGSVQITRQDRGRGTIVNYLETDFGTVTKVYNRNMADTDALLLPAGHVELCTLRPLTITRLAKTGDSDEAMMVGEVGCKVHAERWAGRFTALNT